MKNSQCDFKQKLKDRMQRMGKHNGMGTKGAFVSEAYLKELFTARNLKQQLRTVFAGRSQETLENLSKKILQHNSKKLYATLVLIDQAKLLLELDEFDSDLDDTMFNAESLSMHNQLDDADAPDAVSFSHQIARLPIPKNAADALYKKQWIIPPRLCATPHYMFPIEHFVFPFENAPRKMSNGSYGVIYEVDIAEEHLDWPQQYNRKDGLVYKKISKAEDFPTGKGWTVLLNEVTMLRARQHSNIMPLLASFGAGHERRHDADEFLYMISPRAEIDMKEWMKHHEGYRTETIQEEEIHKAMEGLASALAYIHSETAGKLGFHHDLKPGNILRFVDQKGGKVDAIWKICDFGCSNLKRFDETGTRLRYTTWEYAPPEYFEDESQKHGRAFDVFSLGCVFLELATVLHYGWQKTGLTELRRRKYVNEERKPSKGKRSPETTNLDGPDLAYWRHLTVVDEWILNMRQQSSASKTVLEILKLVEEMLLGRYDRIFAWEVEVDLFELLNPNLKLLNAGEKRQKVFDRLVEVVQVSNKPINGISKRHNPLRRAKNAKRGYEWYDILEKKHWSDDIPQATSEVEKRPRVLDTFFSTLPILDSASPLYGRNILDKQISQGFSYGSAVVLYGLGGIGKSYMAHQYALRFKEASLEERKHTFWIQASSVSSIDESCRKFAAEVGLDLPDDAHPNNLRDGVKAWLEDVQSGRWFLVIDGLEHEADAAIIATLRPKSSSGQILYTTRERRVLKDLVELKFDELCIEVTPPELEASLRIFEHHVNKTLANIDATRTRELVSQCNTPLIVKLVAEYMTTQSMTSAEILENIKSRKFSTIDLLNADTLPSHVEYLLRPLLRRANSQRAPIQLRLLCLLAAFNKESVDFSLIRTNFDDHELPNLREWLSQLVSSSYLKKTKHNTYSMHEFIQLGLLHWMKTPLDEQFGIPQQYERALAMLWRAYDKNRTTREGTEASKVQRSSYLWKLPYMPHFERFLSWVLSLTKSETSNLESFKLRDPAVKAIITFSHVYLDQDRHNDAIRVLEFALAHHNKGDQTFNIGKNLIKAYISRPSRRDARQYWIKSEDLLQNLAIYAKGNKSQWKQWDLELFRVRLFWESKKYAKALEAFRPLRAIGLRVLQDKPRLPEAFGKIYGLNESKKMKSLCIRVREEEGKIYLARGQHFLCIKRDWTAAMNAFSDCKTALEKWFPAEKEWIMRIESNIADASTKLATTADLKKAEIIIEARLNNLRGRNLEGNQQRIWDAECKLAAVKMEENEDGIETAIGILKRILEEAEHYFQRLSRHGENRDRIRKIVYQLRKAYIRGRKLDEAKQLELDHPGLQKMKHDGTQVAGTGWAMKGVLCVVLFSVGYLMVWFMRPL